MSFGSLRLRVSGSVMPAAASSPVLVHVASNTRSSATVTITFPNAPTAGNLLVVTVFAAIGATPTATPAGWNRIDDSGQSTSRPQQVFTRVSDGTETGFSATYSASASYGVMYSEWQGASTIAPITGSSVNSGTSTPTVGPSAAPPVAGALPLFFTVARNAVGQIVSVPAGWTLSLADTVNYVPIMTYMQTAPGAAVSETLTLSQTTTSFYQWASTWIY